MRPLQILPYNVIDILSYRRAYNKSFGDEIKDYIGQKMFTVELDSSPKSIELIGRARELRGLCFAKKLEEVKKLALEAFPVNAYEQMIRKIGRASCRERVYVLV